MRGLKKRTAAAVLGVLLLGAVAYAAPGYIPFGSSTSRQSELRSDVRHLQDVIGRLARHRGQMIQMIDGSDYTALESEYGVAAGKGDDLFNELDSLLSKVNTNDSVSNTKAAVDQMVAKAG